MEKTADATQKRELPSWNFCLFSRRQSQFGVGALPSRAKKNFSFFFIMRCPGRHRAEPTTGSGGPCAGPQVPVPTLWPNLGPVRGRIAGAQRGQPGC
eukprot:scaffold10597_cov124-Isochrysis_galbana.AAC.7